MAKNAVKVPAIREKKTGKVIKAPSKAWSHTQLESKAKEPKKAVKEGFVTEQGDFIGRKKAAKVALKAGEIKKPVEKLHSTDLRKGAGTKKKVFK